MTSASKNVAVVMGGVSGEHPISLRSAATVVEALEGAGHRVVPIGITRAGVWRAGDLRPVMAAARRNLVEIDEACGTAVALVRDASGVHTLPLEGSAHGAMDALDLRIDDIPKLAEE